MKIMHGGYPVRSNASTKMVSDNYRNHNSIRQQNAMKLPNIIPSLLFFVPILPMRLLMPGTWLAAPTILRLMFASDSRCTLKFSWTAYAWLSTESATLCELSMRRRSSSMYSASAWPGFEDRYASMSDRTLVRRFARFRASVMVDLRRRSSRRWSESISRCRERLFCFTAEDECASESSRRVS
jgi:hypothetical protein